MALLCSAGACKSADEKPQAPSADSAKTAGANTQPAPDPTAQPAPNPPTIAAPTDPKPKIEAVMPMIHDMAAEPAVVKAVKDRNKKQMSLDEIKKTDAEWTAATGVTELMKPYMENACAKTLAGYARKLPALVEAFAMDDDGGLVCTIKKTSDYWQGDEPKWQESFAGGKGSDFIDKPSFDDSSQTYSVQVSSPVMDGQQAIGAITVGLGLDKL